MTPRRASPRRASRRRGSAPRQRAAAPADARLRREASRALRSAARFAGRLERRNAATLARVAGAIVDCLSSGGTVFTCGNGGSAADAQHFACELSGRFLMDRPGLPCVALTTNTSSLTAIANDFGYDQVFERQLQGLGRPGDVLLAFSTSGRSESVLRAVRSGRGRGLRTVAFTGQAGATFAAACDLALVTPSRLTPRIQEGHLVMMHAVCELVERALFGGRRKERAGR